jgi:uncharacterized protein YcfL
MVKRYLFFIAFCLLIAGCGGISTNILDARLDGNKTVIINDGALNRQITFGEIRINGAEVQVELQNKAKRDVNFEYRFIWYDSSGVEISTITNWIPTILTGGETRGFKSTQPSEAAVGYKLMIRRPHEITPFN